MGRAQQVMKLLFCWLILHCQRKAATAVADTGPAFFAASSSSVHIGDATAWRAMRPFLPSPGVAAAPGCT
jgi:hypothetical protein